MRLGLCKCDQELAWCKIMFCDNSPVIVDAQAIFIPIIIQHTGRRMNCIYVYLLEDGDTVYCLDSLHEEVSQCEGRPAQPQTHRSPEPWQQIHLLHDVVLLQATARVGHESCEILY